MYLAISDNKDKAFTSYTVARLVANLWSGKKNTTLVVDDSTGEVLIKKQSHKTIWKCPPTIYGR